MCVRLRKGWQMCVVCVRLQHSQALSYVGHEVIDDDAPRVDGAAAGSGKRKAAGGAGCVGTGGAASTGPTEGGEGCANLIFQDAC